MKLLVLSHTPHYRRGTTVVGFGPTVRELSHLAGLFTSVVHLAPLYPGPAPDSALPYGEPHGQRVELRPLPPAGGSGLGAKFGILAMAPSFLRLLRRELARADVWHLRAPTNLALLAMAAFPLLPAKSCWVKYAGNWRPDPAAAADEAWSYRWQRRWLAKPRPAVAITVNGRWPGESAQVTPFRNPSFTTAELLAAQDPEQDQRRPLASDVTVELLFVGRLDEKKGAGRAIEILAALHRRGIDARLELIGDGPLRAELGELGAMLGVQHQVCFAGELPRPDLAAAYRRAHFLLLPTRSSEGWPKVLSEAMAYGALPLAGAVSSIPQGLAEAGAGRALPPLDGQAFLAAIDSYLSAPGLFAAESRRAREAAADFTYDRYLAAVKELFETRWKLQLAP